MPSVLGAALFRPHSDSHTTTTTMRDSSPHPPPPPDQRQRQQQSSSCYGYHNTFHTHAVPADPDQTPPTYDSLRPEPVCPREALPTYSCSVLFEGPLGFKSEYHDVFERTCTRDRQWQDVYVVLRGTQLNVHRLKTSLFHSRSKRAAAGRLMRSYSLQHAEVGLALDFKKTELVPRSALARLVPLNARAAVYETDPHLFLPVREHAFRLRCETDQFLLCSAEPEGMLDWVEQLCAAVDISPPLDDRSEPRYRSLPRRGRRQRQLDGRGPRPEPVDLTARRLLAEQERIIRTLYPNLARDGADDDNNNLIGNSHSNGDADADDLDASDMLFPGRPASPDHHQEPHRRETDTSTPTPTLAEHDHQPRPLSPIETHDPSNGDAPMSGSIKLPRSGHAEPSASSLFRYRRRCAPVLLSSSPRASEVIYYEGKRMRVQARKQALQPYRDLPPHYAAHRFTQADRDQALNHHGDDEDEDLATRPALVHRPTADSSLVGPASLFHLDVDIDSDAIDLTPMTSNELRRQATSESVSVAPTSAPALTNTTTATSTPATTTSTTTATTVTPAAAPMSIPRRAFSATTRVAALAAAQRAEHKAADADASPPTRPGLPKRFLSRAKAPLTSAAEAFGGLVI
ncbi:uncharacterized protein K452DRAFT_287618 [Aplosporella prunicola CBS 121167]|uniref:PH domain-containing protein n=1 Tax=Aplosporella prunicola CBS 121167 TaxID=1176127 RepID=A0A6A6BFH3_9PEZI|nr:uncharacterized protein K452DRAFT_287618 [Aplosporella prunicola CBS 121167]KAF2141667.1 hypothetical protein K452DRAFT_287618 [Aplosporella prunicola CBS 121167]